VTNRHFQEFYESKKTKNPEISNGGYLKQGLVFFFFGCIRV